MKTYPPRQTALRRVAMLVPGSTALTATAAFGLRGLAPNARKRWQPHAEEYGVTQMMVATHACAGIAGGFRTFCFRSG